MAETTALPTVTVAIACYNQGHFLAGAIDSVLAQTRPVDAIIVVDDGSCDITPLICRVYPQVRYVYQANAGLSAARNHGLQLAATSHVLFLDADDQLLPDAIALALARFAERPGIAFAYGGYREIEVGGAVLSERPAREHGDAFLALLHDNHIGMHGTVLYDADVLRGAGGFDPALRSCEDYDVYLKLTRAHPIAAYPGLGALYRRHGATLTANYARMIETSRAVIERQIAQGLTPEQLRMARRGIAFNRRYQSLQMIGALRLALRRSLVLLWQGVRLDPWFPLRLIAAAARAITRSGGSRGP